MTRLHVIVACTLACLYMADVAHGAIFLNLDYRYDTNDFFGPGNADGADARATLEAAADVFEALLAPDSLDAIPFTDPGTPGNQNTPVWRQVITHPGTAAPNYAISSAANASEDGLTDTPQGTAHEFRDIQVPANTLTVYAGGSPIGTSGLGGTGVGFFGLPSFNDSIDRRGKPAGEYAVWGGFVTFNDTTVNWHYDHTDPVVGGGRNDLYSVALHELAHMLGVNTKADEFLAHVSGTSYFGPAALAAWNADNGTSASSIPLDPNPLRFPHWQENAVSANILGTSTSQEAAMDPIIFSGTRKLLTHVDAFVLDDIGWAVDVPEPTGVLFVFASLSLTLRRRWREIA